MVTEGRENLRGSSLVSSPFSKRKTKSYLEKANKKEENLRREQTTEDASRKEKRIATYFCHRRENAPP